MFKKLIICLILTIKLINCAFPEFRLYTPTNKNDFTLVDANNLRRLVAKIVEYLKLT